MSRSKVYVCLNDLIREQPTVVGKSAPKPERKPTLEKFKAQYGL